MSTTRVILFDIDKTIFNTPFWLKELVNAALIARLGITVAEFETTSNQYHSTLEKYTDFNPAELLPHLGKTYGVSTAELSEIFYRREFFAQALYPDVMPMLTELKNQGHVLGIFSEGNEAYQRTKLRETGLDQFLNPEYVFICKRKEQPEVLEQLQSGWVIVDDNKKVITTLREKTATAPVWMNRYQQTDFTHISTITSLTELAGILGSTQQ